MFYLAGIGYAIVVVLILVNTYYNVLIAYSLFYLFASITSELPWSHCDNKWNTKEYCITDKYSKSNELFTMIYKWSVALLLKPYKILHILIDMTFLL